MTTDTVLHGETRDISGDVVVRSGATLGLHGTFLRLGGRLLVEPGARLDLGPWEGQPTRLSPLPDGTGFWIDVQGEAHATGLPMTEVQGLSGKGLESILGQPGGLRVNGTANLQHLHVRDGATGLIVGREGHLLLRDSVAENLGLMGLAVLGNATVANSTLRNNIISVSGRDLCTVEVRDSTVHGTGGAIQMNSCNTTVSRSDLSGATNGAFIVGPMTLRIEDSVVHGYRVAGVEAESRSRVELQNVELRPGPGGWHGIHMKAGTSLVAHNVTASGHVQNGLLAQAGRFEVHGGRFLGNSGFGILLVRSALEGGLERIDFGTTSDRRNGMGAYGVIKPITASLVDAQGQPLGGNLSLHIFVDGRAAPVLEGTGQGSVYLQPNAWQDGPDGHPEPATGHSYLALHPTLHGGCLSGALDLDQSHLVLNVTATLGHEACASLLARLPADDLPKPAASVAGPAGAAGRAGAAWVAPTLLGAGIALVLAAFFVAPTRAALLRALRRR